MEQIPYLRVYGIACVLLCVCFITAGPITKLFAWGRGEWRTWTMRDDEPRPVWMSLFITH